MDEGESDDDGSELSQLSIGSGEFELDEEDEASEVKDEDSALDDIDNHLDFDYDSDADSQDNDLDQENMDELRETIRGVKAELDADDLLMSIMEQYVDAYSSKSTGKTWRTFESEEIDNFNDWLFNKRLPNGCIDKKKDQLLTLRRLYDAYERQDLEPDMMYFYLLFHIDFIDEMLDAISKGIDFALEFFKDIPNHLANLPIEYLVLADRGFAFDAFKYPHLNAHITPAFLKGKTQFSQEILEEMWKTCMLRWSSETHISLLTNQESLQDVVPFPYFNIMQNCIDWASGMANFQQPLQPPETYKERFPKLSFDDV
jgi:hypothetical protein